MVSALGEINNHQHFYGRDSSFVKFIVFVQYFADRDIFCAGRVTEEDLQRVAAATGGNVQTTVNNVIDEVIYFILLPMSKLTDWRFF